MGDGCRDCGVLVAQLLDGLCWPCYQSDASVLKRPRKPLEGKA